MSMATKPTLDLGDQTLRRAVVVTSIIVLCVVVAGAAARATWPAVFAPGAPLLQSTAILGALLLVGAFVAALAKRFGGAARAGFRLHVWLALLGVVLVAFHSTGAWSKAPMSLLVITLALVALGGWGRTRGAHAMAATFGSKRGGFTNQHASPEDVSQSASRRAQFAALIERKRALLAAVLTDADEAQFSVQAIHCLQHPLFAWRYQRLVLEEAQLLGRYTLRAQAWWRLVHQLLAWSFVLGLLIHIVLAMWLMASNRTGGISVPGISRL